MNAFEQKLVGILNRSANGEIIPVEHCLSNSPSRTAGKVTQTVSFSYDIPEPDTDIFGNKIPAKKHLDAMIDDLRADNDKLAIEKEHLQEQVQVLQSGLKLYSNHLVEVIRSNTLEELKRNKKEV